MVNNMATPLRSFPHRISVIGSLAKKSWCKRYFSAASKMSNLHASLDVQNKIGLITLKSPGKVNVLNLEVSKEIEEVFNELKQNPNIIGGVLISNKPDCFIAGADINMLSTTENIQQGTELSEQSKILLDAVEQTKKPIVAAIMGSCLGGGLEVALACHYRLAVNDKKTAFGVPEVLLGLLPGAGGTQRLPKLVGLPDALDMLLTGKTIRPDRALKMGLIDKTIDQIGPGLQKENCTTLEYLTKVAVETSHKIAVGDIKINREPRGFIRKSTKILLKLNFVRNIIFKQAKDTVIQQTKGLYPAPLKILEVVKEGQNKGEIAGYKAESKGFGELVCSKESKGLQSLFHGQTECKKNKFGKSSLNSNKIAIIGAGELGTAITSTCINNGFEAVLSDINLNAIEKAESKVQNFIKTSVKKKKKSVLEGDLCLSRFHVSPKVEDLSKTSIAFEAVSEDVNQKRKVLRDMEEIIPEHCIYITSTSSLLIKDICELSKRPEKVVGMYYASPIDKMPLVEVVKTEITSNETLKEAVGFVLKQKKIPIIVKDRPGFYTNRVNTSMLSEALRLILEGVNPEKIDKLSMKLGFPKGPVTVADELGLDVVFQGYIRFVEAFGKRYESCSTDICSEIINSAYLGKKCGKGFYSYSKKSRKTNNQDLLNMFKKYNVESKIPLSDENIQFRLISRFINESLLCLEEEVVSNSLEADIGAVFGLGFPPFTGGPFHYVDSYGANKIASEMRKFEEALGPTFTPCQLLQNHAKNPSMKFFPQSKL